jgi:hypothetical protein
MIRERCLEFVQRRFLWLIGAAVALKWLAISDVGFSYLGDLRSDGSYVRRAYEYLANGSFGPYDGTTLSGGPGISWWVAAIHAAGLPYVAGAHLAFAASLAFFVWAADRCGFSRAGLLFAFVVVLFAPQTLDVHWFSVTRAPLLTILLVAIGGCMLLVFETLARGGWPWFSSTLLGIAIAALGLVEDNAKVLLAAPVLIVLVAAWVGRRQLRAIGGRLFCVVFLPWIVVFAADHGARSWVEARYGARILDELSEGEYPKLWAAMMRVEPFEPGAEVSRAALENLRAHVPAIAPAISALPNPGTCPDARHCEWRGETLKITLLAVAHGAGLTPDLGSAQRFYREVRLAIVHACSDETLSCSVRNPFHPSLPSLLARVLQPPLAPADDAPASGPELGSVSAHGVLYPGMPLSAPDPGDWTDQPAELHESLRYWLRYPDVASARGRHGVGRTDGLTGARLHYERHGRAEGRTWGAPAVTGLTAQPASRLGIACRRALAWIFGELGSILEIVGGVWLCLVLARRKEELSAIRAAALVIVLLTLASWLAVFTGSPPGADTGDVAGRFHAYHLVVLAFCSLLSVEAFLRRVGSGSTPAPQDASRATT